MTMNPRLRWSDVSSSRWKTPSQPSPHRSSASSTIGDDWRAAVDLYGAALKADPGVPRLYKRSVFFGVFSSPFRVLSSRPRLSRRHCPRRRRAYANLKLAERSAELEAPEKVI
jgi:hypothetical protein